jgi:SAM-dependent methyltransferase
MPSAPISPQCPLCFQSQTLPYHQDRSRSYCQCRVCRLVFVPPEQHLSPAQEKARYDLHQNEITDPGYRTFLSRILHPVLSLVPPPASGLDVGSGPGPALAAMCREAGYAMDIYDPFYAPDPKVWEQSYDLITCTETVEHFRRPGRTLPRIWSLLRPGGWLAVMTKLAASPAAFAGWHYIRDETHVSFFSLDTFQWIAGRLSAELRLYSRDIVLLHKKNDPLP